MLINQLMTNLNAIEILKSAFHSMSERFGGISGKQLLDVQANSFRQNVTTFPPTAHQVY